MLSRAGEREQPGERVDVPAELRRAAARWEPAAAAAGVSLAVEEEGDGSAAWIARADLERIVDVVTENAIAYSPPGRAVVLAAGPGWVEVRDRGAGIDPDEEEAVFERFHRGRAGRAGPAGTGLGLAIARELSAPWGGTVRLRPRQGGGAVARVELPLPSHDRAQVPA